MQPIDQILVLDIETVSAYPQFSDMPLHWQQLWVEKYSKTNLAATSTEESYAQRAAIMAEFGQIICISVGYFTGRINDEPGFRVTSFCGSDEARLLSDFLHCCEQFRASHPVFCFGGHNIREFDIPYLCRRLLAHSMPLPDYLFFYGKKPWEVKMMDTLELWRFGDYKNYTSLKLITATLGIPGSKQDMDGSAVGEVYYKHRDLKKIAEYCRGDVVAVARLLLKLNHLPSLPDERIIIS